MDKDLIVASEAIALFCRLQMNTKRDVPVRPSEMGVLIFTQQQSIPVTPLMISNFFKITKPSVTSMVNSLIQKDYLAKMPSSTDGRSYTVSSTEKGNELVNATFNEYYRTMESLKKEMGIEEFNVFIQLIQKVNNLLIEER